MPLAIRDFLLAFSTLTAVPVRATWPEDGTVPDAASFYPVVGLLVGVAVAGIAWVFDAAHLSGGIVGLVLVGLVAFLTRGMHWDGLADVADAWYAPAQDRERIMKDSATGAFAAVALVLTVGAQAGCIGFAFAGTFTAGAAYGVALVFGRLAATFAAWLGKPARPEGLGASVMRKPGALGVVAALASVVIAVAAFASLPGMLVPAGVLGVVGLLSALVVPHLASARFGGVSGDVMGASIVLTETVVLIAFWATMSTLMT